FDKIGHFGDFAERTKLLADALAAVEGLSHFSSSSFACEGRCFDAWCGAGSGRPALENYCPFLPPPGWRQGRKAGRTALSSPAGGPTPCPRQCRFGPRFAF